MKVLHSAWAAYGYMHAELFHLASQLPWSLCQGDVEANLAGLKEAPAATEACSWKVQKLLAIEFNMTQLTEAVKLLAHCPWATTAVEQQHGSIAVMKRWHPTYTLSTLVLRGTLHTFRTTAEVRRPIR